MAMSTGYHTFCCHSKDFYHCWLSYDLCGISFSLLAIYTTGIYYAFWCQNVRLLGLFDLFYIPFPHRSIYRGLQLRFSFP